MDISEFNRRFKEKMKELEEFADSETAKTILKTEAIEHFKESFANEGFTDETLEKWPEVERRKPGSPWYGHTSDKETKYFSSVRTTANILYGSGGLMGAFKAEFIKNGVRILNTKPYAAVHQRGLPAKIYGKTPFTMPRRRFVGRSKVLIQKIKDELKPEIIKILKS